MSTKYWIAKYVPDPLRNEARNVGVLVQHGGVFSARFVGEREDGVLDGRKLGGFSHPDVYSQWRRYWRTQLSEAGIAKALSSPTANYFLAEGGEVADAEGDSSDEVCRFLFDLLIGGGPLDAYQWHPDEDGTVELSSEIVAELDRLQVLAKENELFARHPVVQGRPITGQHVTHTPAFSQRNGRLYVFDQIDLSGSRPSKIKERAGLLGYMFSDILAREHGAVAYSLVRPENDNSSDAIAYARQVLNSESRVVNWADENERGAFLEERKRVAV